VRDRLAGTTERVSVASDGGERNGDSLAPAISADGRYVAFSSYSSDLVADDTNFVSDIFVKDLQTGALTLASRTEDGRKAVGGSESAALSADGLAVAFSTRATNLSPGVTDGESHVYVKRLDTGTLTLADGGTIERPDEQTGAYGPSLSANGHIVAFVTDASGLDRTDTDRRADVYVRDLDSGEVRLASLNQAGVKGDSPSTGASLTADGTRVAFQTTSGNLVPEDADSSSDIYVKNLTDGSLQLASTEADGTKADRTADQPSLSPDGRYLAFGSDATNLGLDTPALVKQIYRKDLATGELRPASVAGCRGPAGDYLSIEPSIAQDGRVVAFASPSTNLAPDGGNRVADVFAKVFAPLVP
jgi:Tol biopolymer transport system component